jgi:hypothetical protein
MNYFWNTLQIVGGILCPIILWYCLRIVAAFMSLLRIAAAEKKEEVVRAAKLSGRWVVDCYRQTPNPTMSEVTIINVETQDKITFSEDKQEFFAMSQPIEGERHVAWFLKPRRQRRTWQMQL